MEAVKGKEVMSRSLVERVMIEQGWVRSRTEFTCEIREGLGVGRLALTLEMSLEE